MTRNRRITTTLAVAFLATALGATHSADAAVGPPDALGWAWADSDEAGVDVTVETPTSFTLIASPLPDEGVFAVPLSLPFTLYDQTSSTAYLSTNGWLSLSDPLGFAAPTNVDVPDPGVPNATLAYHWDDLDDGSGGSFAQHGPTPNGHLILVRHFVKATGSLFQAYIQFYNNGAVKVVYLTAPEIASATIGIESRLGGIGNRVAHNGTVRGGANLRGTYAIVFYPAQSPNCPSATPLTCGGGVVGDTLTGANDVNTYGCTGGNFDGRESIYAFTLPQLSRVDFALSGLGGRNQYLFLLRPTCDATLGCMWGGSPTLNFPLLAPGTYYVVVDGGTAADDGSHTLTAACTPVSTPITCGSLTNDTASGASGIDNYSCYPGAYAGPERIYSFSLASPQTVTARITPATPFNLFLVDQATLAPITTTCIQGHDSAVATLNLPAGNYAIVVDGPLGASGSYALQFDCQTGAPSIPVSCGVVNAPGSNVRPSMIDTYSCAPGSFATGEEFYAFQTPARMAVTATLGNGATHDVFGFREADLPNGCFGRADTTLSAVNLAPDNYVMVVDSNTTEGPVNLSLTCTPMTTTDIACEETLPGVTAATSLLSGYTCFTGTHTGGESFFVFNNPVMQSFAVAVIPANPAVDLDVAIIQGPVHGAAPTCLGGGDRVARVTNAPPGEYLIAVDGAAATNGAAFTVTASCGTSALACPAPIDLSCNSLVSGDTTLGTDTATLYAQPDDLLNGRELVYRFTNPGPGNLAVSFLMQNADSRLDVLLLTSCDPTSAIAYDDDSIIRAGLPPGTYFVVVDGRESVSGPFDLVTFCGGATLDPPVLATTLSPGQCYRETKRLFFPVTVPNADVMFSFDLSGSMGQELDQVKANARAIYTALNSIIPSLQFGLASFVEYATAYADTVCSVGHSPSTGGPHFQLNQALTTDIALIDSVLQTINLIGGAKETYTRTFYEAYANPAIGWRSGCARKLWLSFGDEPAVDCNWLQCSGGTQNTGRDPGPDLLTGTPDDLELIPTVDAMGAAGISLIPVESSENPTQQTNWDCLARRTGGQAFFLDRNGNIPGGTSIVDGLVGVILETVRNCPDVRLVPVGPSASWVTISPVSYTNVTTPFLGDFTIDFCVPPGTPTGNYPISIEARCMGAGSCVVELLGTQSVSIDVVECPVTPTAGTNTPAPGCVGDTTTLDGTSSTACSAAGLMYRWLDGATVVCPWSPSPTCDVAPTADTSYTLEVSCADAPTCVASTTVLVPVVPYPTPTLEPLPPICVGQSTTLDASTSGTGGCAVPLEYQFRSGATIIQPWSTSPLLGPLTPPVSGTYWVDVRCTATPGCAASASQPIEVVPLPIADAGPDDSVCDLVPLTLSAAGSTDLGCPGGLLYEWRQGMTVVRPFSPIPTWNPPTTTAGTTTYTVVTRCASTPSCESQDTVTVEVRLCSLAVHFDLVEANWSRDTVSPQVDIHWRTVSELGTTVFTVERAPDRDGSFAAIGEPVAAVGPGWDYRFADTAATPGSSPWYRVVEWTVDGRGDVSPAVQAQSEASGRTGGRSRGARRR